MSATPSATRGSARDRRRRWTASSLLRRPIVITVVACAAVASAALVWAIPFNRPAWRLAWHAPAGSELALPIGGYAVVFVPSGALRRDALVSIRRVEHVPAVHATWLSAAGDPLAVTVDGPLDKPAVVTARYDARSVASGKDVESVFFARLVDSRWVPQHTIVDSARRNAGVSTSSRRAVLRPFAADGTRVVGAVMRGWENLFSLGTHPADGECLLSALSASAVGAGCGPSPDGTLRVVNDQAYGVVVFPPEGVTVKRATPSTRAGQDALDLADGVLGERVYVPSGETATLAVDEPGRTAVVQAAPTPASFTIDYLEAALEPFRSARLQLFSSDSPGFDDLVRCLQPLTKYAEADAVPSPDEVLQGGAACLGAVAARDFAPAALALRQARRRDVDRASLDAAWSLERARDAPVIIMSGLGAEISVSG